MDEHAVYLSYRRSLSYSLALALYHGLREFGCDVFVDLRPHDQRDALHFAQIEARAHFVMVLAPGVIEALQKPNDPMLAEIEHAIHQRRNIIPVYVNGFRFASQFLPKELSFLRRYNGLPVSPETMSEALAALNARMRGKRIFGTITPAPDADAEHVQRVGRDAAQRDMPSNEQLHAEAIFNRARTRDRNDTAAKLADYDEVLRLNPLHLSARFDRARARLRSGDSPGALADYDEVLCQNPRFYRAFNNRAELHFVNGAYETALADYDAALELHPTYTMALTGRAITLHVLARREEAFGLWGRLLEQDAGYGSAQWVGRQFRLPKAMTDEAQRLIRGLKAETHAADD